MMYDDSTQMVLNLVARSAKIKTVTKVELSHEEVIILHKYICDLQRSLRQARVELSRIKYPDTSGQ